MSMLVINQGQPQISSEGVSHSQRAWGRIAGLMYWMVLLVDLTGLQLHSVVGTCLVLSGSLLTVPLALRLYYAVRPADQVLAIGALGFRLLQAAAGLISTAAAFGTVSRNSSLPVSKRPCCNLPHGTTERPSAPSFSRQGQRCSSTCLLSLAISRQCSPGWAS
jgi:hypothetical protein